MSRRITLIPGDGTGPELAEAARKCIEAAGVGIEWDVVDAGAVAMEKYGTPLPDHVLDSIRKNRVALKGPVTTPLGSGFRSVNVALRKELGLFACVRPCRYLPGVNTPLKEPEKVDLVIVRENTEDLYAGIEFESGAPGTGEVIGCIEKASSKKIIPGSGLSIKPISEKATRKIVEYAFRYAENNGRKSVTCVTKSNIMKHTDGLFMRTAEAVSKEHPGIKYGHVLVDNMCMQLVQRPELYDVLVLPNLYGDIISDLCAGLVGGLGVAPGANIGEKYAVFEATHGSAPKYAGMDKVNPSALILSGALMLEHIGENEAAGRLETAVLEVIREGRHVTYDLKQDAPSGTREMVDAIIKKIKGG